MTPPIVQWSCYPFIGGTDFPVRAGPTGAGLGGGSCGYLTRRLIRSMPKDKRRNSRAFPAQSGVRRGWSTGHDGEA
jgi:hypothetical protein